MEKSYKTRVLKMFASPGVSLTAVNAHGTRILTKEFGELIDFESGCWAAVLGHNNKEIVQTIAENAAHLLHTHQFFDTEHPEALVNEITSAANLACSYKGTFMSSGSEAVSLAVKLAELISSRPKKLCLSISYLGSSSELRMPRNPDQWLDLDVRECLACTNQSSCSECGKFEAIDFTQMSAFVFEPGNSGGLVLCPPEKLIAFLSNEIKNAGGFIIANEVTTGFGRTGKWFGFQHYECLDTQITSPDFIAMGKGLGNGYPISGVLVKSDLADKVEATGFRHVQSHTDDPLGCIVSRKVVEIMVKGNLVEHGNHMGEYLRDKLNKVRVRTGGISEIRGRGMMNVVVFGKEHNAQRVFTELLKHGIFTGYSEVYNYIHLYSPLLIEPEEIDKLCSSLEHILQTSPTL
jgi:acetylornithine/N-succinyldiaminopimelate aminotransferase